MGKCNNGSNCNIIKNEYMDSESIINSNFDKINEILKDVASEIEKIPTTIGNDKKNIFGGNITKTTKNIITQKNTLTGSVDRERAAINTFISNKKSEHELHYENYLLSLNKNNDVNDDEIIALDE